MPNSIGAGGLTIATYAELVASFTAAMQAIYGNDIVLTSDSPDGQWMNIIVMAALNLEELLMQINAMFDPDQAVGVILDQRCAINGIQRQQGTFTVTNITLVITQALNLYGLDQAVNPVFTIADNAGNQWQLQTTQLAVSPGTVTFSFQSATPGANPTIPNTITVPITIVLGVASINNPSTYTTLGINEESDAAFKIRRQKSVSLSSQGYLQGLLAALENIPGVTSASVYENNTGTPDGLSEDAAYPLGTPGHTIWAIVAGTVAVPLAPAWNALTTYSYGTIVSSAGVNYISWQNNNLNHVVSNTTYWGVYNAVAQAIYAKRNAGAGMRGETSYTITQIDASPFVILYDVVTQEVLYASFTVTSLDGKNMPNITAILAGLVNTYGVNQEVNINMLTTMVNQIDPNTLVTFTSSGTPSVGGFSTSVGGAYTNTLSPALRSKQFSLSSNHIIILPIQLSPYNPLLGLPVIVTTANTQQFTALGGLTPFTYSFVANNSGGTINSGSGLYTAGAATGVVDTIEVTDTNGNTGTALVNVVA